MSSNEEFSSENYGDSLQLTNWILYSGATCHMTLEVTDFIPGSLDDTDKYIEVADGHHVTAKQKVSVLIQMCDDNVNNFIATLCSNEKDNYAYKNVENNSDCNIYAYIAGISSNDEWKNHGKTEN